MEDDPNPKVSLEQFQNEAGYEACGKQSDVGWIQCPEEECERPDHFEKHRPAEPEEGWGD